MANANLLKLTMLYIQTFPEQHDQHDWVNPCDSTMCFAGHAAVLSGATFKKKIYDDEGEWLVHPVTGKHKDWQSDNRIYVSEFARQKLGLTQAESDYLFHQSRTKEQLEEAVEKLADGYTVDYYGNFYKEEN